MKIDILNGLPNWEDEPDEGENLKTNATAQACKALYQKWNEVIVMLTAALGTMKDICEEKEEHSFISEQKVMLLGDAYRSRS